MQTLGIGVAAIGANDVITSPHDSFDNKRKMACKNAFSFPYLPTGPQDIARAYDAICTPDFLGSTAIWNCNTEGGLMPLGASQGHWSFDVICLKP